MIFPLRARFVDALLRVVAVVTLVQTDFGIVPIKVGGGLVRVKDSVTVSFNLVAERTGL